MYEPQNSTRVPVCSNVMHSAEHGTIYIILGHTEHTEQGTIHITEHGTIHITEHGTIHITHLLENFQTDKSKYRFSLLVKII